MASILRSKSHSSPKSPRDSSLNHRSLTVPPLTDMSNSNTYNRLSVNHHLTATCCDRCSHDFQSQTKAYETGRLTRMPKTSEKKPALRFAFPCRHVICTDCDKIMRKADVTLRCQVASKVPGETILSLDPLPQARPWGRLLVSSPLYHL